MSIEIQIDNGIKKVSKTYDGIFVQIPAILDSNGDVDLVASEQALDIFHWDNNESLETQETKVPPYVPEDVGEI
tara:strand:- start:54 stop:275 length:222 start_codon:yes stop_codon:yes gene_type:complete